MEIKCRIWIEKDGKHVLGKGGAEILKALEKYKSLSKAAKHVGMSYRFAWMYINRIEENTGVKIVERERGGKGGGKMTLTENGKKLLKMYEDAEKVCEDAIKNLNYKKEFNLYKDQ